MSSGEKRNKKTANKEGIKSSLQDFRGGEAATKCSGNYVDQMKPLPDARLNPAHVTSG